MDGTPEVGIYGGGPVFTGGSSVAEDLRQSGFTTLIAWSVHVEANGDLVFNDPPAIVQHGSYVGPPEWPAQLASFEQTPTTIDRIVFSVGAGENPDFTHVADLVKSQGTAPGSILHDNFAALKSTFPGVKGIDFDDEDYYEDPAPVVSFAQMLHGLGFDVSFCPYTQIDFWMKCLGALNSGGENVVRQLNLQCYSGGWYNDPATWIDAVRSTLGSGFDAPAFVRPGLGAVGQDDQGVCVPDPANGYCCPADMESRFAAWRAANGVSSGWLWFLDPVIACKGSNVCPGSMETKDYANAIRAGLAPG